MTQAPEVMWDCPLDVDALARASVQDAVAAARSVARVRGTDADLATTPALVRSAFAAIEHLRVDGHEPPVWAPLSGFFEASDGWVRLHGNYPHHAHAITDTFGVTERDDLASALLAITAGEIEDEVTARRGIATVVRTPAQWRAHPHGVATAADPWWSTTSNGERDPLRPTTSLPLHGVRVLDLTRVIAGPTCSQLLACLGADVLRIDPPQRPEILEQHLSNGMGKRSATLDLRTGSKHLRDHLLPRADVVLVGYRPGSLAPFGLDPRDLAEVRPDLVTVSLSAWGEGSGPWRERAGFDSVVQAATGISVVCGAQDRPGALPVQALDHATGFRMAAAVMRSLAAGRGSTTRISLVGAARALLAAPRPHRLQPPTHALPTQAPPTTVEVGSPHGTLVVPPPPVTLGGRTLELPVDGLGTSPPTW